MSLEKSQKIIKIMGILHIIGAILSFVGAISLFGFGGAGAAKLDMAGSEMASGVAALIVSGVFTLIGAIASLVMGWFCLRAAKDATKVQPLWIVTIIGLVLDVIGLISGIMSGNDVLTKVFTVALSAFTFYLANNIKKNA